MSTPTEYPSSTRPAAPGTPGHDVHAGSPDASAPHASATHGGPPYGGPAYGSPAYGSPAYGSAAYGSAAYGSAAYGGRAGSSPHGGSTYPSPPGAEPPPPPSGSLPARGRRRPGWPGVAAAAAGAALAASLGTAALTGAFSPEQGSTAYDTLGRSQVSIPVSGSTADNPDWQVVAAAVRESVVAITVVTPSGEGEGSGVVISADGQILTNAHVVSGGANGQITVALADGRLYEATIVGTDETTDVAVIQVVDPPDDLAVATLGDSDEAVVGAAVMAVGNPLGLDTTVTTGIISAVDRPVTTQQDGSGASVVTNAIQVDAAINPGNSGGPLFNSAGEVIGITSSIATLSSGSASGSIGLGFAIPVNQAVLIADQLVESGTAEHAYLGVTLSDGTGEADGTTRQGAVVRSVASGTPADAAGLSAGDVVVGMDGRAVSGAESLTGYVRQHASGDDVTLTVVRDGRAIDLTVTLATKPVDETTSEQGSGTVPGTTPQNPFGR